MAVLDRLGAALSGMAGRYLPPAVVLRDGAVVLHRRVTTYVGLSDAMFHMIRQAGAGQAAVLIRLVEVIDEALDVEADPARRAHLLHHVRLAAGQGGRALPMRRAGRTWRRGRQRRWPAAEPALRRGGSGRG